MAIDGITIKAIVEELNEKLVGGHIQKVYQLNNHVILLNIYNKGNYKLLISSNPQNARLHLTNSKYDNPTKPPQFAMILRKHIQNYVIKDIKQISLDRSVEIIISGKDDLGFETDKRIMIDIMGKHSNIVLTDKNYIVIEAIKRISHEMSSVRAVYPGTKFSKLEDDKVNILDNIINLSDLNIAENTKLKRIFYMNYTGFGPQVGDEIVYRANLDISRNYGSLDDTEKERLNKEFIDIASNIINSDFSSFIYTQDEKTEDFYPIKLLHKGDNYKELDSISDALDIYYSENVNDNSLNQAKDSLRQIIINIINKSNNKLINLESDYKISENYEQFRIEGDLLSSVAHNIKKGDSSILVHNYYTNEELEIELNPRKSAWENIDIKYKKSKKLHKANSLLKESIPSLKEYISYLNEVVRQLDIIESNSELEEIKEELRNQNILKKYTRKKQKEKNNEKSTYLRFETDNGNYVYVGKNNKQNEELTLRVANPDDLFFHIKDLPGSHVILKKTTDIKDYEINIAAFLAAKFSKNGNDRYIDVDYTEKKNVNKSKGSKPGMVYYTNYITLRVDLEDNPEGYMKI